MTEIRVPTLGESVTEATIGKWFKKAGDAVRADETLSGVRLENSFGEACGVGDTPPSAAAGAARPTPARPGSSRRSSARSTIPAQPVCRA